MCVEIAACGYALYRISGAVALCGRLQVRTDLNQAGLNRVVKAIIKDPIRAFDKIELSQSEAIIQALKWLAVIIKIESVSV